MALIYCLLSFFHERWGVVNFASGCDKWSMVPERAKVMAVFKYAIYMKS